MNNQDFPKKAPFRKARVLGSARERIVESEESLGRARLGLQRAQSSIAKKDKDLTELRELFSHPIMRDFGNQIKRDIAESLANEVSRKIINIVSENEPLYLSVLLDSLDKNIDILSHDMADTLISLFMKDSNLDIKTHSDAFSGEKELMTRIYLKPEDFTVCFRLPSAH
jgi:hypothetical protein